MTFFGKKQKLEAQERLLDGMRSKLEVEKARANEAQRTIDAYTHLRCSFCGKTHTQVKKLIAGPACFICDGCVVLCVSIIVEGGVKCPA